MKRIFLCMSFCVCVLLSSLAQDVIFRSNTDSIVAKVLTVGSTEVTYQKWSNLEGPIYSVSTSEIAAIRYANGSYDFFNKQQVTKPQESSTSKSPSLMRSGNTYYYKDTTMSKSQMLKWLETQNCPTAYEQFKAGYNHSKGGWLCLSLGIGMDFLGGILIGVSNNFDGKGPRNAGIALACVGSVFEIVSIPVLCVSYHKMHAAVDVYNVSCSQTASIRPYWAVQTSTNGIGLAYHF